MVKLYINYQNYFTRKIFAKNFNQGLPIMIVSQPLNRVSKIVQFTGSPKSSGSFKQFWPGRSP